jgi:hypothetical protein
MKNAAKNPIDVDLRFNLQKRVPATFTPSIHASSFRKTQRFGFNHRKIDMINSLVLLS